MPSLRTAAAALSLSLAALFTAGCESLLFRFANRGLAPPDATAVHAPGHGLSLDVYRAATVAGSDGATAAPVVVFFYGGAWQRGARGQYRFVGRRLADNGILAIVADYRTWPDAGFPAFMGDAASAVAWARAQAGRHGGDPQRLFVAGHSAGAQIAALLAADSHYLAAEGLAPADLAGVIGLSGPYDFHVGEAYAKIFGPPSQWPRAQAVNFVNGDEPPFLLMHGRDDRVVEALDSRQLADLLQARGVPAEVVLLGGGHDAPLLGLYDPELKPQVLQAIRDFVSGDPDTR